jgi:hypothetical protein
MHASRSTQFEDHWPLAQFLLQRSAAFMRESGTIFVFGGIEPRDYWKSLSNVIWEWNGINWINHSGGVRPDPAWDVYYYNERLVFG